MLVWEDLRGVGELLGGGIVAWVLFRPPCVLPSYCLTTLWFGILLYFELLDDRVCVCERERERERERRREIRDVGLLKKEREVAQLVSCLVW